MFLALKSQQKRKGLPREDSTYISSNSIRRKHQPSFKAHLFSNSAVQCLHTELSHDALLYIGQTENLQSKVWLHKKRTTDHLGLTIFEQKLVYVEQFDNVVDARTREQELTMLPEIDLRKIITTNNPKWDDLFEFV
ncbi:hypothetical protein [Vibrio breoganii]|uniref:hypothetical protein n=1 Tax=Vibrio breoganii TaxID=553239 RepID=UPI001F5317A7|nr:hypothetical protein [Vibrio breoganii]